MIAAGLFGLALAASQAGPPPAESFFSVRNLTSRPFTCGLFRAHRSVLDQMVLHAGREWRVPASRGTTTRSLICDTRRGAPRWRLEAGVPYYLMEHPGSGRVILIAMESPGRP